MRIKASAYVVAAYCLLGTPIGVAETIYEKDPTFNISLVQLITDPERYVGRKVEVTGYFLKGINPKLFLNHLSADARDTASAIEVIDQSVQSQLSNACDKKYVSLVGRFVFYRNRYSLVEVERVRDAMSVEVCWEKQD